MAAIHELLKQVQDSTLRERLAREWEVATKNKKFGLVYEQHLPELVPLYKVIPRRSDLVCRRSEPLTNTWRVRHVNKGIATCVPASTSAGDPNDTTPQAFPLDDLMVVRQFGEVIYPTLTPIDAVQNGPKDTPWHALIEADNYHALQLLDYLYAGKVDCIYIDPPYNTGARDWKYNNDYVDVNDGWRHSKWLSFMEKRLRLAKRLLKPDTGVLICTIDEHEVHHLGALLAELFPDFHRQLVTIIINQKGVSQGRLSRVEEYAIYCFGPGTRVPPYFDDLLSPDRRDEKRFQTPRWEWLQRGGNNATPEKRSGLFYPINIDPTTRRVTSAGSPLPKGNVPDVSMLGDQRFAWPIRRDGTYATWQVGPQKLMQLVAKGFVRVGGYDKKRKTWTIQYLGAKAERQISEGTLTIVTRDAQLGCVVVEYTLSEERSIKTVWHRQNHDSGIYGSSMLRSILGEGASFTFPKSVYSTRDAIATVVRNNPNALVVDFFAGSGTTLNAVNLLNALDGGRRQCILVTNNEVAADEAQSLANQGFRPGDKNWEDKGICRSITWPRSKFTILGKRNNGTLLAGDYTTGRTVEVVKPRRFRHLAFVKTSDLFMPVGLAAKARTKVSSEIAKVKKSIVALIDGLPQNAVTADCKFIVSPDHKAAVLFDPEAIDNWLLALDEQQHIVEFYIVSDTSKEFESIKEQVEDLLGPRVVYEEEKRPLAQGFEANLVYFKLDFLDKNKVAVGAAFREIVPVLWLKSGGVGPCPNLPATRLPEFFLPETANFGVLLRETRVAKFLEAAAGHKLLSHVYIVTDSEDAFRALTLEVGAALKRTHHRLEFIQLYRDYLVNFMINKRQEDATTAVTGSEA